MEIKPREIIVSISIVAIMLLIGLQIHEKIQASQLDANEKYNKAVKIESTDLFQYGMDTNVGNAFVYGDLLAVDTVTYPEIDGEYIYVEKIEKRYERHTRTVTKEDANGNEYTETEVYYTWDTENIESKHSNEIMFCGVVFPYGKIDLPYSDHITTIKGDRVWSWESFENVKVKFEYYGIRTKYTGTIFTELKDKTISDDTNFYENKTIEETVDYLKSDSIIGFILFWMLWILLTGCCVYGFCYLDNRWLD